MRMGVRTCRQMSTPPRNVNVPCCACFEMIVAMCEGSSCVTAGGEGSRHCTAPCGVWTIWCSGWTLRGGVPRHSGRKARPRWPARQPGCLNDSSFTHSPQHNGSRRRREFAVGRYVACAHRSPWPTRSADLMCADVPSRSPPPQVAKMTPENESGTRSATAHGRCM